MAPHAAFTRFEMMKRWLAIGVTMALLLPFAGCGRPPQIGTDKEVFKAVDALYTAVGLKDARLVADCHEHLARLQNQGKLPQNASKALDKIVAQTKQGDWETAQARLSDFMEGQRR